MGITRSDVMKQLIPGLHDIVVRGNEDLDGARKHVEAKYLSDMYAQYPELRPKGHTYVLWQKDEH